MTIISPDRDPPAEQVRTPRSAFSLRTLFLAVLVIAAAAALIKQGQQIRELRTVMAAHDVQPARFSAEQYSLQITKLTRSSELLTYEIAIDTLGSRRLKVGDGGDTSEMTISMDGRPEALAQSHILIVADLINAPDSESTMCRYLIQIHDRKTGNSVGGPSTYVVPRGKTLDDLFQILVKPGVHDRGKKIAICTFDGHTDYLTVR